MVANQLVGKQVATPAVVLSDMSKVVLTAIMDGVNLAKDVAAVLGLKTSVVTGTIAGLKRQELVIVDADKHLLPTATAKVLLGIKPTARTGRSEGKAARAREIFNSNPGAPRQEVLNRFMTELGLSKSGASTYYQNCRHQGG